LAKRSASSAALFAEYEAELQRGEQTIAADHGTDDRHRHKADESASAVLTLGGSPVVIKIQPERDSRQAKRKATNGAHLRPQESASQDQAFYSALRPGESQMPPTAVDGSAGVTRHEQRMLFDDPLAEELEDCLQEQREHRHRLDQALEWMDDSPKTQTSDAVVVGPPKAGVVDLTANKSNRSRQHSPKPTIQRRNDPRRWKTSPPFSWKKLCFSAMVSGGLGAVALMVVHWATR